MRAEAARPATKSASSSTDPPYLPRSTGSLFSQRLRPHPAPAIPYNHIVGLMGARPTSTSPRSVAFIANSHQVGGGNRSLLTLAGGLLTHRIAPVIVSPAPGELVDQAYALGLRCVIRATPQPEIGRPFVAIRAFIDWLGWLQHERVELVHANGLLAWRSIALSARVLRIPVVCHVRFPPALEELRWLGRRMPSPSVFVFNSESLLAAVAGAFVEVFPRSARTVIHNAVDLSTFLPRREGLGGPIVIGAVANLQPIKGHEDFLAMARLVLDLGLDAEFVIVGDDIHATGHGEALRRLASELGLRDKVRFTGYRNDVAEVVRGLDILVVSSHLETFGRAALEAMACQVPVVATRVGGLPEVVNDGITGILVPINSPAQLAEAVLVLAREPELRQRMGAAGRLRAVERFGVEAHAAKVATVYDSLLK
jgi:glycosyltransferase involved in cell wall biosynthesis